jgi:hypothetical protein
MALVRLLVGVIVVALLVVVGGTSMAVQPVLGVVLIALGVLRGALLVHELRRLREVKPGADPG